MKVLGDEASFVGLDGSYEMPFQIEISELMYLDERFLKVVFSESMLSSGVSFPDCGSVMDLAYSEQRYTAGRPSKSLLSLGDLSLKRLQRFCDSVHAVVTATEYVHDGQKVLFG